MAQDMAGETGKVTVKVDEREAMIIRNALRMYVKSKVRAANANSDDGDLNSMFNAQARSGSDLSRKFGG